MKSGGSIGWLGSCLIALLIFTLGCQIHLFSYILGYDLLSVDGLTRNSCSFVLVLFSIVMATDALIIQPRFQKRLQKIHTEWVRQYGVDPENWPNP